MKAHATYQAIYTSGDGLGLLMALKTTAVHFQDHKYIGHSVHEALKCYYNYAQGKFATTQSYNSLDAVIHCGGTVA